VETEPDAAADMADAEAAGVDDDEAALEALERESAALEGELDVLDHSDSDPPAPDAPS
jgi:hypothetical protein